MKYLLFYLGIATLIFFCKEPLAEKQTPPSPITISNDTLEAVPFASIRLDKQNTAYIGLDNPVSINTNGLAYQDLEITTSPGATYRGGKKYGVLKVLEQGGQTITVSYKGQVVGEYTVIAKRIPNPTAYLGNATSGMMEADVFKTQAHIYAPIANMDIQATCSITGFQLLRVSKSNDRSRSKNEGGRFNESTMVIIQQAAAGDIYQFTRVLAKCPEDEASRELNPLAFEII